MIERVTRNPVIGKFKAAAGAMVAAFTRFKSLHDKGGFALKTLMAAFLGGLGLLFVGSIIEFGETSESIQTGPAGTSLGMLPSAVPIIFQGVALLLALIAFVVSLFVREGISMERRRGLVVISLAIASVAALAAWLPTDVMATREAILGKAPAGETPSIPAYLGMLFLVSALILSIPAAALAYFRLGLMDRYLVHNFLSPFAMCLFSFMAIFVLADLTDKGDTLAAMPFGRVLTFYVVQIPFILLFVMPIAVLLSGLFALAKMSKANEFISMIGAGRSVPRILAPLFIAGAYVSLVGVAFKYQWGPESFGYTQSIIHTAKREHWMKGPGARQRDDIWSKRGWMHMNEVGRRSWFVGRVPLNLSDEMGDVVVTQLDENDQPTRMWIARRAKWVWDSKPPRWVLTRVRVYSFDENHVPVIESAGRIELTEWNETPWKVLSSSQNPEYLGIPGLTMYLNANRDLEETSLAPFRTNWWYIFAEPISSLAMILVAAPLGIVYSRRGVMGGVTGAICIFALMYVMRGTFLAMGHSGRMPPFLAAWLTNFLVCAIGLFLLWKKSRNEEIPKPGAVLKRLSGIVRPPRPAPVPGAVSRPVA
ncbi:MAG: LptF/LptG family permease [Verrucomicrobia bacterium]|jgi:lipopolysaccharide export system permease protein|nr:LptF/LptG family permease [Verrucomicrobiota bacterium]